MHESFHELSVESNFGVLVVFAAVRFLALSRVPHVVKMVEYLKKAVNEGVKEDQIAIERFRRIVARHYYLVNQDHISQGYDPVKYEAVSTQFHFHKMRAELQGLRYFTEAVYFDIGGQILTRAYRNIGLAQKFEI